MSSKILNIPVINLPFWIPYRSFTEDFAFIPFCFNGLTLWQSEFAFTMEFIKEKLSVVNETVLEIQFTLNDDSLFANAFKFGPIVKLFLSVACEQTLISVLTGLGLIDLIWTGLFGVSDFHRHLLDWLVKVEYGILLNRWFTIMILFLLVKSYLFSVSCFLALIFFRWEVLQVFPWLHYHLFECWWLHSTFFICAPLPSVVCVIYHFST